MLRLLGSGAFAYEARAPFFFGNSDVWKGSYLLLLLSQENSLGYVPLFVIIVPWVEICVVFLCCVIIFVCREVPLLWRVAKGVHASYADA